MKKEPYITITRKNYLEDGHHMCWQRIKRIRLLCSKKSLKILKPFGSNQLSDIITEDETWLSLYGIQTKPANQTWLGGWVEMTKGQQFFG